MPGGTIGSSRSRATEDSLQPDGVDGETDIDTEVDVLPMEEQEEIDESPLNKSDAKLFRGMAARLNYMGPDRPDMQYAIKESSRCMANPRQCDWRLLKKLGRYLIHRPRMVLRYAWQRRPSCLDGYTDSDWAAAQGPGSLRRAPS